jgi:CcmD family protein
MNSGAVDQVSNASVYSLSPEEAQAVANDPQVQDAVRAQIQAEEYARFQRAQHGVVLAYSIIWVVLVAFVLMLLRSQRRLRAKLADLERRLRKAEEAPATPGRTAPAGPNA